jgi:uncharacterized membrane protein
MQENKFSIWAAFRFAIYTLVDNFAFFLALILMYIGLLLMVSVLASLLVAVPFAQEFRSIIALFKGAKLSQAEMTQYIIAQLSLELLLTIVSVVFIVAIFARYLALGFTKISLNFYEKKQSSLRTLLSCYHLLLKDLIGASLYWCICGLGFILIIPGIYCSITFGFYHQFIVDQEVGPIEALRRSALITRNCKWELFALWVFFLLLNYTAFVLFGLTVLVSWPLQSLLYVYVYKKLLHGSLYNGSGDITASV